MSLKQLSLFASKMIYFIWFNTYTNDGICGRFTESNPVREFYKFVYKLIYGIQAPYSLVLLTILYVGRLKLRSPAVVQQDNSGGTEYRAFVCALVVANKYLDDKCFINSAWVEALNTTALDLTQFEFEFLKSINYDLYVSEIQYNEWIQTLEGIINAGDQYICFKISSPEFQYTVHQQISMLRKRTYKIAFGDQFGCGMFVSASKRAKLDDQEVVSREMFSLPESSQRKIRQICKELMVLAKDVQLVVDNMGAYMILRDNITNLIESVSDNTLFPYIMNIMTIPEERYNSMKNMSDSDISGLLFITINPTNSNRQ
ncbi:2979_t:CDS:2 [Diversispora eburnea]|uniref:2979_t:CDS:1 n=1 Tax=Diversispora eburnea TaxID=1213867 RepID=A0A9N8ZWW3_9GLOM|nr:2979_t:CDS:2 [Diversispora eburnea]